MSSAQLRTRPSPTTTRADEHASTISETASFERGPILAALARREAAHPLSENPKDLGDIGPIHVEFEAWLDEANSASRATGPSPASVLLSSPTRLDDAASDVAISVLPSVRLHAAQAEIAAARQRRYTRVRLLGEGGVSTVDLAYDNDVAGNVAVKRLKGATPTPANVARFIDEIQAVGSLQHPGIAPIHDVGFDEDGYFFTMKYVDGETLEAIVEQLRGKRPTYVERFSIDARVAIFMQVLRTLEFAHDAGYIHCDLKPANVMVGPFGEVLVMDWGLAKRRPSGASMDTSLEDSTSLSAEMDFRKKVEQNEPRERAFKRRMGSLLGSPGYMSPEQALGLNDRLDERNDVYSLSVLFFELLSLRYYLDHHKEVDAILHAIVHEDPASPIAMHRRYGIPPEYTFFLQKGLQRDVSRRFQSVHQMRKALQRIQDGDVPVQCPCTGIKRASGLYNRFLDRHPIGGVAAAALVGGLSVLGALEAILHLFH